MRDLKEEKGITLVALIITIIVLLILAVVTISAVNEGSLFAHANNAARSYDEAARYENAMVANHIFAMEKYDGGSNKEEQTGEVDPIVGTYVLSWQGLDGEDNPIECRDTYTLNADKTLILTEQGEYEETRYGTWEKLNNSEYRLSIDYTSDIETFIVILNNEGNIVIDAGTERENILVKQ